MDNIQEKLEAKYQAEKSELRTNISLMILLILSTIVLFVVYFISEPNYYVLSFSVTLLGLSALLILFTRNSIVACRTFKKALENPEANAHLLEEERPGYLDNELGEGQHYTAYKDYSWSHKNKNESNNTRKPLTNEQRIADLEKELADLKKNSFSEKSLDKKE